MSTHRAQFNILPCPLTELTPSSSSPYEEAERPPQHSTDKGESWNNVDGAFSKKSHPREVSGATLYTDVFVFIVQPLHHPLLEPLMKRMVEVQWLLLF